MTGPMRHFNITGCCNFMWPSVNFSLFGFNARKLNMLKMLKCLFLVGEKRHFLVFFQNISNNSSECFGIQSVYGMKVTSKYLSLENI